MPTPYPKCSPTEMMGLLVLLDSHKGDQEIARLADDLDLEIDEILPAVDFAEVLGLLSVRDGRLVLTDSGKALLAGSIGSRKALLREHLKRTTLFKALLRALESSPEKRLTEEQVNQLIAFTTAPADSFVQNIINWGRYTEMFRYDSDAQLLLPARVHSPRTGGGKRPPSIGTPKGKAGSSVEGSGTPEASQGSQLAPLARAAP